MAYQNLLFSLHCGCESAIRRPRKLTILRLRQTDVKAGHFERKVQALEQDRDQWESKYEEMAKKYAAVQKELEDFQAEIGNI
jgi:tropomyosin